jgi:hypothetical protein
MLALMTIRSHRSQTQGEEHMTTIVWTFIGVMLALMTIRSLYA